MSFYRNIICGAVKVHKHFISISPLPQQPPPPFPSLIYKWTSQTCFSSKTQMSHVVVPFYTWIYWYTYYKTVLKELDNNSIFIALSSTIQYKYKKHAQNGLLTSYSSNRKQRGDTVETEELKSVMLLCKNNLILFFFLILDKLESQRLHVVTQQKHSTSAKKPLTNIIILNYTYLIYIIYIFIYLYISSYK